MKKKLALGFVSLSIAGLLTAGTILPTVNGGAASTSFTTWTAYSTNKVIQQATRNESFINTGDTVKIKMMREEYESSQLIITSEGKQSFDLTKVDLIDNNTGKTLPKENIEIFVQKYMKLDVERYSGFDRYYGGGDMIPDMLLPIEYAKSNNENYIEANSNQGITIQINSFGVDAGVYTGNFTLRVGDETVEIPVEVTVWDILLEGKSDIQTCWLIYSMYMFTGEFDASERMMDIYSDFLTRYKANPYVIQESVMNSPEALFQDVERMWGMKSYNSIIIPYDFPLTYRADTYEGTKAANYIVKLAEKSTEENFYLDYALFYPSTYDEADVIATKKAASPEFFKKGGQYDLTLEKAITILEQKGYFTSHTDEWNNRVKEAIRNIPDIFTNCGYVEDWVSSWPATYCPRFDALSVQKNQQAYQDYAAINSNNDFWTYTCCDPDNPLPSHHLDDDCLSMRVLGWQEKSLNVNGYLYYMANMYAKEGNAYDYSTPYEVADRNGAANGDGYVMYPGRPYGSPEPFPSMRLVTYRDGLEDYDMLDVYENKIEEMAKFYGLENIDPRDYVKDIYGSLFNLAVPTDNHETLFAAREELAERILSFENDNNIFTSVRLEGENALLDVYSTAHDLKFNGLELSAEEIETGKYHYVYNLSSAKGDVQITSEGGSVYTYHNDGYNNITKFGSSNVQTLVSDQSTFEVKDGEVEANIVSVRYESTNKTIRFKPTISINNIDLTGGKKLYFEIENTSSEKELYFDLDLSTDARNVNVGGGFCLPNHSKTIEIDLTYVEKIKLEDVNTIQLTFVNYYFDENDEMCIEDDRNFVLGDFYLKY